MSRRPPRKFPGQRSRFFPSGSDHPHTADGNELLLSDILGTEEDGIYRSIEAEADKKLLYKALEKLGEREKIIVKLRFGLNTSDGRERTQKEVADLLGISQSYISRLEKKIMKRLKKEMLSCGTTSL